LTFFISSMMAFQPASSNRCCSGKLASWQPVHTVRTIRFMRWSSGVASGSPERMTFPGNCSKVRSGSFIAASVKSCRPLAARSTSPLAVAKLTACAQTRYFPAGSGGK